MERRETFLKKAEVSRVLERQIDRWDASTMQATKLIFAASNLQVQ
jgi:hypothetical protein